MNDSGANGGSTVLSREEAEKLPIEKGCVTIPHGYTEIGEEAFIYWFTLEKVIIPDGVTSIEERAFADCPSLKEVVIPSSVTAIAYDAFFRNKKIIKTYPECPYTREPGNYGESDEFRKRCTYYKIKKTTFHCRRGSFAHQYCMNNEFNVKLLKSETSHTNHGSKIGSVLRVGSTVLNRKDAKKLIMIKGHIDIPHGYTEIGEDAFGGSIYRGRGDVDSLLKSVTIPDSVTKIGRGAFERCEALESVIIPDSVTSIGEDAFKRCRSLTELTIPCSVTAIGKGAFAECGKYQSPLTVYCPRDSYAHQYCAENKLKNLHEKGESEHD